MKAVISLTLLAIVRLKFTSLPWIERIAREAKVPTSDDVFNNTGYPFIDVHNGGDIDGMIKFCRRLLTNIDGQTRLIPGHESVVSIEVLRAYIDMLKVT